MKVRTHYMPSDEIIYTKTGTAVVPVFSLSEDEKKIIKVGKRNVQKEINSHRESTDINVILHQLSINDSTMAERLASGEFKAKEGAYFDSTVFPKTLREFHNMVKITDSVYGSLPKEITSQFDSIDDFVRTDDSKLQAIFNDYFAKINGNNDVKTDVENTTKGDAE